MSQMKISALSMGPWDPKHKKSFLYFYFIILLFSSFSLVNVANFKGSKFHSFSVYVIMKGNQSS